VLFVCYLFVCCLLFVVWCLFGRDLPMLSYSCHNESSSAKSAFGLGRTTDCRASPNRFLTKTELKAVFFAPKGIRDGVTSLARNPREDGIAVSVYRHSERDAKLSRAKKRQAGRPGLARPIDLSRPVSSPESSLP
jgi:hypothetical protein